MPRKKEDFTLYPRRLKSGKVYYFQAYDASGQRIAGRSTGKSTKTEARLFCNELLKTNRITAPRCPTLSDWVSERHWYDWPKDSEQPNCLYAQGRLARSSEDRPAVQKQYIIDCARYLKQHILPTFGNVHLDRIMPDSLEKWMFSLEAGGLAPKSINNIASAFRVIMAEARRLRVISEDPWQRVQMFQATSAHRGSLNTDEAIRLMNPRTIGEVWGGHRLYYLISLAAMITACRQCEILACRRENLYPDHLEITKGWHGKQHKAGPTKTKITAPVAIPKYLYDELLSFCQWSGYIFSFNGGLTPATGNRATEAFNNALTKIGISQEIRSDRHISFHSWRTFCNTYLRAYGVSDAKIRGQTRHITEAMTDHYTDWKPEDFADVVTAQAGLIAKITS